MSPSNLPKKRAARKNQANNLGYNNTPTLKKPEPSKFTKFLLNLIFFVVLGFLFFAIYLLYENYPRDPIPLNLNVDTTEKNPGTINPPLSKANQFYTNMRFNHKDITYRINADCNSEVRERMKRAFAELIVAGVTELTFTETVINPDIEISCTQDSKESSGRDPERNYFIAGEGGAREIIPTGRFHVIETGVIYIFDENKKKRFLKCDYPNIELHELMHVFGFDHNSDENSLMFPFLESCDQKLDQSIVDELNRLYSQENLPELFFQDINSVKKGKYLDFNLTIKNSGSIESKAFTLTILDNGEVVDTHDIKSISYGAGITLSTTNLRLKHRNPDEISFIIDFENLIEEIDESNNEAITKFS